MFPIFIYIVRYATRAYLIKFCAILSPPNIISIGTILKISVPYYRPLFLKNK